MHICILYKEGSALNPSQEKGAFSVTTSAKLSEDTANPVHDRSRKRRRSSNEETVAMEQSCDGLQMKQMQSCSEHLCNPDIMDHKIMAGFEEVVNKNYMKLLDLDDSADEECYRMAAEMPVSPTLPVIEFPSIETFEADQFVYIQDENFGRLSHENENVASSGSFGAINVENGSNKLQVIGSIPRNLECKWRCQLFLVLGMEWQIFHMKGKLDPLLKVFQNSVLFSLTSRVVAVCLEFFLPPKYSWDWACKKIISQLWIMLESSVLESFNVAIVILVGQLGRFGVDGVGYEDKEVENLRGKLSVFLWRETSIRAGLPLQLATVIALLGLTSLDFEKVILENVELPIMSGQFVSSDVIKNWFCLLTEEQRLISIRLFQSVKRR